ncbi:MAG: DUF262 domain-containing protein [Candidatus Poribacteria bacterium]|nr:DUF262 domain-containing protein [Candidatus Poribacteria bacterium]
MIVNPPKAIDAVGQQHPMPRELTISVVESALDEKAGVEHEGDQDGKSREIEPFDPTLIRIETRNYTVYLILRRIAEDEIELQPDFQRMGGIWDDGKQSRLIESMMLRIPLPAFYVDASTENKWIVIDGLQRLTAMNRFMNLGELKLRDLEFLQEHNGKTFDELPRALQRRLEETPLMLYLVQSGTPHKVKFNIFKRINTGGMPLSGQEIRHALNQGPATSLLAELARSQEFQTAVDGGVSPMRMTDRECVLRFLAFKLRSPIEYKSRDDLDSFLNDRMQQINLLGIEDRSLLSKLRDDFKRAMLAARRIFGNQAFRKYFPRERRRSQVSKALFEVWSVNLDKLSDKEIDQLIARKRQLMQKWAKLMDDNEFMNAISYSTGDSRRVRYRFRKVSDIIQETLCA